MCVYIYIYIYPHLRLQDFPRWKKTQKNTGKPKNSLWTSGFPQAYIRYILLYTLHYIYIITIMYLFRRKQKHCVWWRASTGSVRSRCTLQIITIIIIRCLNKKRKKTKKKKRKKRKKEKIIITIIRIVIITIIVIVIVIITIIVIVIVIVIVIT